MEKKDIRVLALDLDGTLTNDQKVVTPATRAALDAAAAKGVTIVLASGRPTAGIMPLAKELGLDKKGGCILSYNGGSIIDCATGGEIGVIDRVLIYPAHRIYQVKGQREYLIPAVPGVFIESTDPDAGEMRVHLMKGLATDEN